MSREIKRTISQFLNGLAVAVFAAGVLAPLLQRSAELSQLLMPICLSLALHAVALGVSARR